MSIQKLALSLSIALAALSTSVAPSSAGYNYTDQERQARWQDLQTQIFGTRTMKAAGDAVTLDAPDTALDAALVPIAITLSNPATMKALYLIIDDNPSPVAAHITFGPDLDPTTIKLRVRINHYTNIHAVAEAKDGTLIETGRYVKASGGCSAPMGTSDEEAMRGIGEMRLKFGGDIVADRPVEATLMIRHPNFNGMQMNEALQVYTPARYIQTIAITLDTRPVLTIDTDISLSSNPIISFALLPNVEKGEIRVDVKDSKDTKWSKTFPMPNATN